MVKLLVNVLQTKKVPLVSTCGGLWHHYQTREYLLVFDASLDAAQAEAFCSANYDASLASALTLSSVQEDQFVRSMLRSADYYTPCICFAFIFTPMCHFRGLLRIGADKGIGLNVDTKTLHGIDYTDYMLMLVDATGPTSGRLF